MLTLWFAAALAADWHEPDNTPAAAQATQPVYHLVGQAPLHLNGLMAEAGEDDWFHLYADCCNKLGASVRWIGPRRALRVELYDDQGQVVSAATPGARLHRSAGVVRITVDGVGGHWYLRVTNTAAADLSYELRVLAPVYGP